MDELLNESGLQPEVAASLEEAFRSCDVDRLGLAKVSKLMVFMYRSAAESDNEVMESLNDLRRILDPKDLDIKISLQQCELGVKKWIKLVKARRLNSDEHHSKSSPVNGLTQRITGNSREQCLVENSSTAASTYSNESSLFEASDLSWDHHDVAFRVEELEKTNRRLMEENHKLQQQVYTAEDLNSSFASKNDHLQKKLARYDAVLEENKVLTKNCDELKTLVADIEISRNALLTKASNLEKENKILQDSVNELRSKVSNLDISLEVTREEKNNLISELDAFKTLSCKITELQAAQRQISEESASESDHVSSFIADLSLANEALKAKNKCLEKELADAKAEFGRISTYGCAASVHSTPLVSSKLSRGMLLSLQDELKAQLDFQDSDAGSPLGRLGESSNESNTSVSPSNSFTGQPDRYSRIAQQCQRKFKAKKEAIFKKLDDLCSPESRLIFQKEASMIAEDLSNDMESFTEKVSEMAVAKISAEARASRLMLSLKKLKEENKQLQESRDKALLKLGNLSISNMESEQRSQKLAIELVSDKRLIEEMTCEIIDLKRQIDENLEHEKLESRSLMLSDDGLQLQEPLSRDSDLQITELKSLVRSLEARDLECSKLIFDMEEQLRRKEEILKKHQEQIYCMQDSLATVNEKHSKELEAILLAIPQSSDALVHESLDAALLSGKVIRDKLSELFESANLSGSMCVRLSPDGENHPSCDASFVSSGSCPADGSYCGPLPIDAWTQTVPSPYLCADKCCQTAVESPQVGTMSKLELQTEPEIVNVDLLAQMSSAGDECLRELPVADDQAARNDSHDDNGLDEDSYPCSENPTSLSVALCHAEPIMDANTLCSLESASPFFAVEKDVNPLSAAIVEFDRSDVSSDSEPEKSLSQRLSFSKCSSKPKSRSMSEPMQTFERTSSPEVVGVRHRKERRIGVSAEPVRVSWSRLREALKKQQAAIGEEGAVEDFVDGLSLSGSENAPEQSADGEYSSVKPSFPSSSGDDTEVMQKVSDSWTQTSPLSTPRSSLQHSSENVRAPLAPPELVSGESVYACLIKDERELERKFNSVVFAFRTDHVTLSKRLENQERARDVAESGMEKEIAKLADGCKDISARLPNKDLKEPYLSLMRAPDVLRKAAMKISAQAEQHGCYQHEHRIAGNIEVIISYTDYLKNTVQALSHNLSECRKQLESSHEFAEPTNVDETTDLQPVDEVARPLVEADMQEAAEAIQESEVPRKKLSTVTSTLIKVKDFAKMTQTRRAARDADMLSRINRKKVSFLDRVEVVPPDLAYESCEFSFRSSDSILGFAPRRLLLLVVVALLLIGVCLLVLRFAYSIVEIDMIWLFDMLQFYSPLTLEHFDRTTTVR